MTNLELKNELQEITNQEGNSIEKAVSMEALESDDIKTFFSDLLQFGCVSGMIGSLVYYADTHEFFDTHYSQIEDLRYDFEKSTGTPLDLKSDLKNTLAWFGFEKTAYNMVEELELEI